MTSLNRTTYLALYSLLMTLFFMSYSISATAEDWECEDITSNISLVKVASDPFGVLSGSWLGGASTDEECGIIGALDDGLSEGSVSYVAPTGQSAVALSLSLDVHAILSQSLQSVTFAALETGGGYAQTRLLELSLLPGQGGADWQVAVSWYGITGLVQMDVLDVELINGEGVIDIDFLWLGTADSSMAQVTVAQTTASSSFNSNQPASPSALHFGVMQLNTSAAAGNLQINNVQLMVE